MRPTIRFFLSLVLAALTVISCKEHVDNPNKNLSLDDYKSLREKTFVLHFHRINDALQTELSHDKDSSLADYRTRSYYLNHGTFLWIDRQGVNPNARILWQHIAHIDSLGFGRKAFRLAQIEADLQRAEHFDFDTLHTINRVYARLEYNLTKAYLRYAVGERFGYVNPKFLLNRLDVRDPEDTLSPVSYRTLFDVKIDRPGKAFFAKAFRMPSTDSLGLFLEQVRPQGKLYRALLAQLQSGHHSEAERQLILCNLEKARWRMADSPDRHDKFVLVNIPAQHLFLYNGDQVESMKIGCGSQKTKTPMLNSYFKRMDVNPQWVIPQSIVRKDVARHAGSVAYFQSRRYFIRERSTGKLVSPEHVTAAMLQSGAYSVSQEGGEGNALGRIIFRFDNNFAVFLHDTSSRGVFDQRQRDVSHGCVRVERPLDLARFLLGDDKDGMYEKIVYSVNADVSSLGMGARQKADGQGDDDDERQDRLEKLDRSKLVRSIAVNPQIPLYIGYYTYYPVQPGKWCQYPDIYGYDRVIYNDLRQFLK